MISYAVAALMMSLMTGASRDADRTAPRSDATVLHADFENYTDGVVQPLNAGVRWLGDPFSGRDEGVVEITKAFAFSGSRYAHVQSDRPDQIARVRLQCRFDAPHPGGDTVAEMMFRAAREGTATIQDLTIWSARTAKRKPVGLVILANGNGRNGTIRLDVVHAAKGRAGKTTRTDGVLNGLPQKQWTRVILYRRRGDGLCDLWVGPPGREKQIGCYPDLFAAGEITSIAFGDTSSRKDFGSGYWDDFRVGAPLRTGQAVAPPEPPLRDVGAERPTPVSPIVVGREKQLFVDDAVIESMTGLTRTLHPVAKHPNNPLVVPDRPWEGPAVLLYGAVVREPESGRFRMWYLAWNAAYAKKHNKPEEKSFICYAESDDGLTWIKLALGRYAYRGSTDNNIVIGYGMSNTTILYDPRDPDPSRRYKGVLRRNGLRAYLSPDGFDWRDAGVIIDQGYDSTTVHWDPVGRKWIASVKIFRDGKRARGYAESRDFFNWSDTSFMATVDERDAPGDQIYAMTVFRYESVYLGLLRMYHTDTDIVDIQLATSRNAKRWDRELRTPFIPTAPKKGTWDYGNNAPATNPPIRIGDRLWFYYSGRSTVHNESPNTGAIGLATLRVDGFVSVDAASPAGLLTTKPLQLRGTRLYVNADAAAGEVRAELVADDGRVVNGFSFAECAPVKADGIRQAVRWRGTAELSSLGNRSVHLRFQFHNAAIYAFWVE